MNGAVLLIPLMLVRYGLMSLQGGEAMRRAAHFPERTGAERGAYWVYQAATVSIMVCLFFLRVSAEGLLLAGGLLLYGLGIVLLAASAAQFARAPKGGFCAQGLYGVSRNPMYAAYFACFLGCALLTRSVPLLALTLVFQAAGHFIILAEERWCRQTFGEAYAQYARRVRRYL